jgi:hypothetical protein
MSKKVSEHYICSYNLQGTISKSGVGSSVRARSTRPIILKHTGFYSNCCTEEFDCFVFYLMCMQVTTSPCDLRLHIYSHYTSTEVDKSFGKS